MNFDSRFLASIGALPIVGYGARTSHGRTAASTFATLRAGIGQFEACPFLRSKRTGDAIALALDATLAPKAPTDVRMIVLAVTAAREALTAFGYSFPRLGMLLALPPDRPGFDAGRRRALVRSVVQELNVPLELKHCAAMSRGHDGGMHALAQAAAWLHNDELDACLVGGVESCADLGFLDWLEDQNRLKAEVRPHGFTPGEGAGFILLLAPKHVALLPPVARAWVSPSSIAVEPCPWYSGRPTRAIGLTTAIAGAFSAPLRALRAEVTYSDLNGEPWRSDEWSFAYIRTADNHGEPMHLRHPADCWGDVGAASAPLLACMAAQEVEHPRIRTETALICSSADTRASRSAALVLRAEGKPEPWV